MFLVTLKLQIVTELLPEIVHFWENNNTNILIGAFHIRKAPIQSNLPAPKKCTLNPDNT